MSEQADRRWEVLARELEFTQLPELRKQAEGWRNGLSGLAALVALLTVLKGRDSLSELPGGLRNVAGVAVGLAFVLLVSGTLLAVRAAHGSPGETILRNGPRLKAWTDREISRVTKGLRRATWCCVSGLVAATAAVAVAWFGAPSPPAHPVRVGEVCGDLVSAGPDGIVLKVGKEERRLAPGTVTAVGSCARQ
ncbi:hypothetical protein ACIA8O_13445 [Kitasatospora sp. NPDC051853]|uniref:hypothetical protein n=1 Tax=Kitasatospora sp. NPDC051853 TaxID=3364058 RepID=UPI0037A6FDFC